MDDPRQQPPTTNGAGPGDERVVPARRGATPVPPRALFGAERSVASSEAQRELFHAARAQREVSRSFHHTIAVRLDGPLDRDALYSALLNLIDRHEALRGRYSEDGMRLLVRERIGFELPVTVLRTADPADESTALAAILEDEVGRDFDLVEGPLFRARLIERGPQAHTLVFSCHHAVVDGWSLNTVLDELPKLYNALHLGRTPERLPAPASYCEHVTQARGREDEAAASVSRYWKGVYPGGAPVLELPTDHPRTRERQLASRRIDHRVAPEVFARLRQAGTEAGASGFVTLLAAYAMYLARISGQDDIVIAVPAAGQLGTAGAPLVGHDTRLLPLRCQVDPAASFRDIATRLSGHFLEAFEHQWISLGALVRELGVSVDGSRAPLASVQFSFDPGMKQEDFRFEGLEASHYFQPRRTDLFEVSINAVVEQDGLLLECVFQSALFDADEMGWRMRQFERLLDSIGQDPHAPSGSLELVPADQVLAMDAALNATATDYERALCVDELVGRIAQAHPRRDAIEFEGAVLDYRELWSRSGRFANAVLAADLGPRPLVGVMLERGIDLVPALLGIWRAGAAFVPLDPAFPLERLQYMVEHSGLGLLLTQQGVAAADEIRGPRRLELDAALLQPEQLAEPPAGRAATDLAYVLYTSGSTGQPKGVQVQHQALHNLLHSMQHRAPGMKTTDRLLAVTTLSFDIAELELWLPLVSGATCVLVSRATAMDGRHLARTIAERGITFLQATPSTWRLLLVAQWPGSPALTALCGGEALPRELADALLPRVGSLWNVYGPTETTVWSTIERVGDGPVCIGGPIANTQVYVLDAQRHWVARGSVGELWIGGDGVSAGYLGREDLTAERFVPNPYTGTGSMYRTGDLVRLRRDGRIEFIGRNDFQVKVNGYRIELADVQYALARDAAIESCVVAGRRNAGGDAVLAAYYTVRAGARTDAAALRKGLARLLPEYMIPGVFVELGALPLTQNGKIDLKALPDPFAGGTAGAGRNA